MRLAVLRETDPSERRVALVPSDVPALVEAGWEVCVEAEAGAGSRVSAMTPTAMQGHRSNPTAEHSFKTPGAC